VRRFRRRRRRFAALALLPLAALTATTTITAAAGAAGTAEIDASKRSVRYGGELTLRGSFDGVANAPVEIQHRAKGTSAWRDVRGAQTDANGFYSARVKPRRTGDWRARLATAPDTLSTDGDATVPATSADSETRAARVAVRSRTRARVAGRHLTVGRTAKIKGRVLPGGARRKLTIHVGGRSIDTRTDRDGTFAARWRARSTGAYKVRVDAKANRVAAGSGDSAGKVTVYRRASASWYGPGLYGNPTACGGTLTPSTLGVAHRTMPCGTKLRLRYRGRTVAVRVIDRGPFAGNREFDLTAATKQRLGFGSTGTVLTSK
jgi:rare lipoprotein A